MVHRSPWTTIWWIPSNRSISPASFIVIADGNADVSPASHCSVETTVRCAVTHTSPQECGSVSEGRCGESGYCPGRRYHANDVRQTGEKCTRSGRAVTINDISIRYSFFAFHFPSHHFPANVALVNIRERACAARWTTNTSCHLPGGQRFSLLVVSSNSLVDELAMDITYVLLCLSGYIS